MGDFREPNDPVSEDWPPSSSWSGHEPLSVGEEKWVQAERVTREIISRVRPTVASEGRRRDVIDYVQRLIRDTLGCELLPFGSVPLKAYLPDGDIDLTAFGDFELEEALAKDVYSVLEAEDRNPAAEFVVKDVQYIHAEVKLVKCLVQNIVVDISFNQIGGLCTLCFLEQVDIRIGKDHLFKRSIILIKAWCYYESRILGSHHGLISTYALEMLVLYIFHLFHTSLNGPLEVFYKFLDYYSKFDWENFCVTLNGPIHISSLQELMAERAENCGGESGDLLLGDDFFKEFLDMFSVPPKANEAISKIFTQKHLNIVDPLKDNNNLGRSVSKASFFRIRSAIALGARKLGRILSQPEENIAGEVRNFFSNTLDRHGRGQRPDVQDHIPGVYFQNSYGTSHENFDGDTEFDRSRSLCDEHKAAFQGQNPGSRNGKISTIGSRFPIDDAELAASSFSENFSVSSAPLQSGDEEFWSRPANEHQDSLVDLSGDYESHLSSWNYGRLWYDGAWMTSNPSNAPLVSLFQGKSPPAGHPLLFRQNTYGNSQSNGAIPRPHFVSMSPPVLPGCAAFGVELNKARGTGMYFPNTNHHTYRERSSPVKSPKSHRNNGYTSGSPVKSLYSGRSYEPLQVQSSARRFNGNPLSPGVQDTDPPKEVLNGGVNELIDPSENPDESGSLVQSPRPPGATLQNNSRLATKSYHLKDEEDFPPLTF